jgi:aminoglycoside phosphotransferase (APT) family kinase protein
VDALLERVAQGLGPFDGEPVPLSGGFTNRNYRWGDYVVRIPGEDTAMLGIDRAGEVAAARLAARLGIGPEVMLDDPLVTRFVEGRTLEAAELRGRADEVHALLDRLHGCGETLPTRFDAYDIVREYARIAPPPARHAAALELARREPYTPVPCHNDLIPGNFIATPDGRLVLLDWEYAGMGDRRFDLANFAMNAGLDTEHGDALVLSLLREAMWGVVQTTISDLDFDFAGYADEHFARLTG